MNQILILTKNILAEQEIQQKLQFLNYEVYCSVTAFEYCNQYQKGMDFFSFFQYVILSESICESEITMLVPLLKKYPLNIIRKVEEKVTEVDQNYLKAEHLNAIISTEDSIDELRECLYSLRKKIERSGESYQNEKIVQLSGKVSLIRPNYLQESRIPTEKNYQILEILHRLSQTESKILSILIQAGNKVVTREVICREIWNEEVSKSHLASLSSTITRIKNKFEQTNLNATAIQTLWGKGYRINQDLLKQIQNDDDFVKAVSVSNI